MNESSIYYFSNYRNYLVARTGSSKQRLGIKIKLAKKIGCQTTYLSQVLGGKADFSLEQGQKANEFFNHTDEESHFFLILIQHARAGLPTLKAYFQKQIDSILRQRQILTERLGKVQSLTPEEQNEYYSAWYYGAIHIALTIPTLRTSESLITYFNLNPKRVVEAISFLSRVGLIEKKGGAWIVKKNQLRIGNSSPNIIKHHTNWRLEAVHSLEREDDSDLHYSGVLSLSEADVVKVKDMMMDSIQSIIEKIKPSKEETLRTLNIDFFSLKKTKASD